MELKSSIGRGASLLVAVLVVSSLLSTSAVAVTSTDIDVNKNPVQYDDGSIEPGEIYIYNATNVNSTDITLQKSTDGTELTDYVVDPMSSDSYVANIQPSAIGSSAGDSMDVDIVVEGEILKTTTLSIVDGIELAKVQNPGPSDLAVASLESNQTLDASNIKVKNTENSNYITSNVTLNQVDPGMIYVEIPSSEVGSSDGDTQEFQIQYTSVTGIDELITFTYEDSTSDSTSSGYDLNKIDVRTDPIATTDSGPVPPSAAGGSPDIYVTHSDGISLDGSDFSLVEGSESKTELTDEIQFDVGNSVDDVGTYTLMVNGSEWGTVTVSENNLGDVKTYEIDKEKLVNASSIETVVDNNVSEYGYGLENPFDGTYQLSFEFDKAYHSVDYSPDTQNSTTTVEIVDSDYPSSTIDSSYSDGSDVTVYTTSAVEELRIDGSTVESEPLPVSGGSSSPSLVILGLVSVAAGGLLLRY